VAVELSLKAHGPQPRSHSQFSFSLVQFSPPVEFGLSYIHAPSSYGVSALVVEMAAVQLVEERDSGQPFVAVRVVEVFLVHWQLP
jgi:hypothetical protein